MNETLKWALGRIAFVMAMTFTILTWLSVGAAAREIDYRLTVILIAVASLITWAGLLACYTTRRAVR